MTRWTHPAALVLATLCIAAPSPAAEPRPHVVLVLADDLGPGDLGCDRRGESAGGRCARRAGHPTTRSPSVAVREGKWKLLINPDGSRAELYDVVTDAGETDNVVVAHPEVTRRLSELALAWRKSLP